MPSLEERLQRLQDPLVERLARLKTAEASGDELDLAEQPTAGGTFAKAAGGRFANNILGIPDLLLTAGSRILTGQPLIDREFDDVPPELNQPLVDFPQVGERVLPIPRVPETDPETRQRFPKSTMGGEIAGDVATIFTGRVGARAGASANPSSIAAGRGVIPYIEPGLRKQLDTITSRVLKSHLPRGIGRAAETGFEGATLAALQNGDPVETGAYAAGVQAGGSLMQTMAKPLMSSSGLRNAVIMGYIGLQAAQNLVPGGTPDTLNTISTAVTKTVGMFALGAMASAAGTSRITGSLKQNLPNFADAVTTIPRATWISLVNDISRDETGNTSRVVEQFAHNPEQFGPGVMVRLQRAMEQGKVGEEVESLMQIPEFARQVMRNQKMTEEVLPNLRIPYRGEE